MSACEELLAPYRSLSPSVFERAPALEERLARILPPMLSSELLALRWMSRGSLPREAGVSTETLGLAIITTRRYVEASGEDEDERVQRRYAVLIALDELGARELFLFRRCVWHLGQTLHINAGGKGAWGPE